LPFGLKKTIHDDRISLGNRAARAARRFAISDSHAGIDRGEDTVGEDHFAAVRNPARIDRAMSDPQSHASGAFVFLCVAIRAAPAAGPVNSDARQQ